MSTKPDVVITIISSQPADTSLDIQSLQPADANLDIKVISDASTEHTKNLNINKEKIKITTVNTDNKSASDINADSKEKSDQTISGVETTLMNYIMERDISKIPAIKALLETNPALINLKISDHHRQQFPKLIFRRKYQRKDWFIGVSIFNFILWKSTHFFYDDRRERAQLVKRFMEQSMEKSSNSFIPKTFVERCDYFEADMLAKLSGIPYKAPDSFSETNRFDSEMLGLLLELGAEKNDDIALSKVIVELGDKTLCHKLFSRGLGDSLDFKLWHELLTISAKNSTFEVFEYIFEGYPEYQRMLKSDEINAFFELIVMDEYCRDRFMTQQESFSHESSEQLSLIRNKCLILLLRLNADFSCIRDRYKQDSSIKDYCLTATFNFFNLDFRLHEENLLNLRSGLIREEILLAAETVLCESYANVLDNSRNNHHKEFKASQDNNSSSGDNGACDKGDHKISHEENTLVSNQNFSITNPAINQNFRVKNPTILYVNEEHPEFANRIKNLGHRFSAFILGSNISRLSKFKTSGLSFIKSFAVFKYFAKPESAKVSHINFVNQEKLVSLLADLFPIGASGRAIVCDYLVNTWNPLYHNTRAPLTLARCIKQAELNGEAPEATIDEKLKDIFGDKLKDLLDKKLKSNKTPS